MNKNALKIALAAIVKNEADDLLEWIAYHWVVGVRHFLIASNDSTDDTVPILQALAKIGLVTFIDYPTKGDHKPQLYAYQKLLSSCPSHIDLIAFIDADEYITPIDEKVSIQPYFDGIFADLTIGAVAMQWACFGSAGKLFREEGMVIERFTRQSAEKFTANKNYKTIVRKEAIKNFMNPHHVNLKWGRYVNSLAEDLVNVQDKPGVTLNPVWDHIRVNHYVIKSLEEFVVGKSRKGSAASKGRTKHKQYFLSHDRNELEWHYNQGLLDRVKTSLSLLEQLVEHLFSVKTKLVKFKKTDLTTKQRRDYKLIKQSGWFDKGWYCLTYPDVVLADFDPLEHYLRFGADELRNPSEEFNSKGYLKHYSDVLQSKVNPLVHYLKFGKAEGRLPH